jgi:hypothetical protein
MRSQIQKRWGAICGKASSEFLPVHFLMHKAIARYHDLEGAECAIFGLIDLQQSPHPSLPSHPVGID